MDEPTLNIVIKELRGSHLMSLFGFIFDGYNGLRREPSEQSKQAQSNTGATDDSAFFITDGAPTDPNNVLLHQREVLISDFDYGLERFEFENGRGFVVVRLADAQHLRWQTLPRRKGLESVSVVGERFHSDAIQDPCFGPGNEIVVQREPANEYDLNAIGVWNAARTLQAGYLAREDAKRLAKKLDRGERFRVLSIWETFEAGRRTGVRLLLIGKQAKCRAP